MKNIIITSFIALSITSFVACKKSDDAPPAGATLTITQPVLNQTYGLGDTVWIQGVANNIVKLHGVHVVILNSASDTLFHEHDHIHATEIIIQKSWVNTLNTTQDLRVIVSSPIDHDGNEIMKEVMIKTQP